jgi:hypothetical protein
MKTNLLVILAVFFCARLLTAQSIDNHHLDTDTEIGNDGSITQYLLYDYNREGKTVGLSALVLGLRAADGSQFLQIAAGPNFRGHKWFLNTYFGGAKSGRLVAVVLGGIDLPRNFKIIIASDPKFPIGNANHAPEIWFSRVWIGRGWLFLRHDNLQEERLGNVSGKAGIEIRLPVKKRIQFYSFLYRDYQKQDTGITAGLRTKLLEW